MKVSGLGLQKINFTCAKETISPKRTIETQFNQVINSDFKKRCPGFDTDSRCQEGLVETRKRLRYG